MSVLDQIDRSRVPQHVAIIMDGNGRWAMRQNQERIYGHSNATTAVRQAVEAAAALGVKYLTLYTFSTENWNRPKAEVDGLMDLMVTALDAEMENLMKNNVRIKYIGDLAPLPEKSRNKLLESVERSTDNTGLTVITAISYSSRSEIARALKKMATAGLNADDIDEETLRQYLDTKDIPDPDLLIRTGGELRVSNFLLWQMAYTEFYFSDQLWPDFRHDDFYTAVLDYQRRQRRFGKTEAQVEEA
jgi:undecaprenyl diphosphate synthase